MLPPPPVLCSCLDKLENTKSEDHGWEDSEAEKDELCNCKFSLAYGGKILLNNALLRLVGRA